MGDASRFRAFRDEVGRAKELIAGKKKAKAILEEAELSGAWDIFVSARSEQPESFPVRTIRVMVQNLVKWGKFSQKQIDFAARLLNEIQKAPEIAAARQAEKDAAKEAPEGRKTFRAEVISTKVSESEWGTQYKMLVKSVEEGWKAWMTIPSSLSLFSVGDLQRALVRGDVIEITATLKRSEQDPKFAIGSRPNGKMITPVAWKDM